MQFLKKQPGISKIQHILDITGQNSMKLPFFNISQKPKQKINVSVQLPGNLHISEIQYSSAIWKLSFP